MSSSGPSTPTPAGFVLKLQKLPAFPGLFNPWRDYDQAYDIGPEAPRTRAYNLTRYLTERQGRTKLLFVGEAPGWQGCKFSGIAMTSERILLGAKEGIDPNAVFTGLKDRSSSVALNPKGANEPTASIAWSLLLELGFAPHEFIFWNALPVHPHQMGLSLTNRKPKPLELEAMRDVLPAMIALAGAGARLVAVGRVAQGTLASLGVEAEHVRHPAMGGATQFREGVRALNT